MSSLINVIFSPQKVIGNLAIIGKSVGERVRIASALEKVQNREIVQERTCSLLTPIYLWRKITGIDAIIQEIASSHFRGFNEDDWQLELTPIIQGISQGLTNGKDIAKVYREVANFPKERWPLLKKASIFPPAMSLEDRLYILRSFRGSKGDVDFSLVEGLSDADKIVPVLTEILASHPDHREQIAQSMKRPDSHRWVSSYRIDRLRREEVSVSRCPFKYTTSDVSNQLRLVRTYDLLTQGRESQAENIFGQNATTLLEYLDPIEKQIAILEKLALIPAAFSDFWFPNFLSEMQKMYMSSTEKIQVLEVLSRMPPAECVDICFKYMQLKEDYMPLQAQLSLLEAIADIRSDERQFICSKCERLSLNIARNATGTEKKIALLRALRDIPAGQRTDVCDRYQGLRSTSFFSLEENIALLHEIRDLPIDQREEVCGCFQRWTPPLGVMQKPAEVFHEIAVLPSEERASIFLQSLNIAAEHSTSEEKIALLRAVRDLPTQEREDICTLLENWNLDRIRTTGRITLLQAIQGLDAQDRQEICRLWTYFQRPPLSADDRVRILHEIIRVPRQIREDNFWQVRFLNAVEASRHLTNIDEIIRNIQELQGPVRARNRHGPAQDFEFLVNVAQMRENPRATLEALLRTVDHRGSFPKIRLETEAEVDRIGFDAGGITRSFITDLMSALCDPACPGKLPAESNELGLLIPNINTEDENEVISYRALGMIFATAFKDNRIFTGQYFSPAFFQMIHALSDQEILSLPRNLSQIKDLPEPVCNQLLKVYLKTELPRAFGAPGMAPQALDAAIDAFVERDEMNQWMKDLWMIEPENKKTFKETFIKERNLNSVLLPAAVVAKSMHSRIERWDAIKSRSVEEFQKQIEGSLSKEQIKNALTVPENGDTTIKDFLIKWINEDSSLKDLENFVYCATGCKALPQRQQIALTVQPVSTNRVPVFHTCIYSIDFPPYANYEEFKEKLNLSMAYILGGNSIGGLA